MVPGLISEIPFSGMLKFILFVQTFVTGKSFIDLAADQKLDYNCVFNGAI